MIERICAEVATRAQRHVHRALTESLTDEQRKKLDHLLESGDGGSIVCWPGYGCRRVRPAQETFYLI